MGVNNVKSFNKHSGARGLTLCWGGDGRRDTRPPRHAAAAGKFIVRGCPQQASVAPKHPMNRLCKSATSCQCIWPSRHLQCMQAATTQGPNQVSRASTGPKNQQQQQINDKINARFIKGIHWEASLFLRAPITEGCTGANETASPPLLDRLRAVRFLLFCTCRQFSSVHHGAEEPTKKTKKKTLPQVKLI